MNKWAQFGATLAAAGAVTTGGVIAVDRQIDPYQNKGTHHELTIKSDIPQGERVEISKTRAEITLKGWNDEYAITVAPQNPQLGFGGLQRPFNGQPSRPLLSKRMEWKDGDVTAFIEPKEGTENEFDIDFTLDAKPTTNVFEYKISGAEDFDFFYQGELTQEEIDEGTERPENVIGSYAVYHKTKANHRVGSTNYATGKAFHIYRPKAIDANGAEVWAELNYENALLYVTVPQSFLDTAVYPIVVDPTLGYTSTGASTSQLAGTTNDQSSHNGDPSSMTEDGTITSITVAMSYSAATSQTCDIYVGLYTQNAPSSGNHAEVTNGETLDLSISGTSANWYEITVSNVALTNGTSYIVGAVGNGEDLSTAGATIRIHRDSGDTDYFEGKINPGSYSASKENPWTVSSSSFGPKSIYATYTASGGGATASPANAIIWFDE